MMTELWYKNAFKYPDCSRGSFLLKRPIECDVYTGHRRQCVFESCQQTSATKSASLLAQWRWVLVAIWNKITIEGLVSFLVKWWNFTLVVYSCRQMILSLHVGFIAKIYQKQCSVLIVLCTIKLNHEHVKVVCVCLWLCCGAVSPGESILSGTSR